MKLAFSTRRIFWTKAALLVLLALIPVMVFRAQTGRSESLNAPAIADWNKLVDDFFDGYFSFNPTAGTSAGFHQYDSQLEDYSRQGVESQTAFAKKYLSRFSSFDSKSLPPDQRQDYRMVVNNLQSTLLELENIRNWEKNPDHYSSGITESAFVIMSRKFAPPENRLKSLVERERKMPAALAAARANLKQPPRIYTEVALEQLPGIMDFFRKDVPEAFREVKNQQLLGEFARTNGAVIAQLQAYQTFLKERLLPVSAGDFRIGADNYRKKLLYDEMVDIPLDRLLQIGYQDLARNQKWFKKV